MTTRLEKMQTLLDERFGGVLREGSHTENGECCALELVSAFRGIAWTDSPYETKTWDLRALNDILVDDSVRTKHLLPVVATYAGSRNWSTDRQKKVARRIVILTVQRIISELPGLPKETRDQCRAARTLNGACNAAVAAARAARAAHAAHAAAYAAARNTAYAASHAAAYAAAAVADAADAARAAARKKLFIAACEVWMEASRA